MASKKAAGEADKDHLFVNSVAKAFRLLEAFDKSRPMSGFSQAAREIGMEKSAAQRAAHTLWRLGYLDKVGRDGEDRLSRRCLDIGQRYLETNRLVVCTNPYLKFLRRKTNASVNLAMLDGTDTVFPVRYTSQEMLNNDLGERARIPAYCTATGIAIFSAMPDEAVREVLERSDLKPLMPNSIWQMDRIMERVESALRAGRGRGFRQRHHHCLPDQRPRHGRRGRHRRVVFQRSDGGRTGGAGLVPAGHVDRARGHRPAGRKLMAAPVPTLSGDPP